MKKKCFIDIIKYVRCRNIVGFLIYFLNIIIWIIIKSSIGEFDVNRKGSDVEIEDKKVIVINRIVIENGKDKEWLLLILIEEV